MSRARCLLGLLLLTGCDGDVWATAPCWVHPRAQVDTIGWTIHPDSSRSPAMSCTTDPRIIINPSTP